MNYHIASALNILNEGHLYDKPEWFMGRLVGSGEIIIALGLSVKSEHLLTVIHFSLLIQFLSMMTYSLNKHVASWSITLSFTFIATCPVLIMLLQVQSLNFYQ